MNLFVVPSIDFNLLYTLIIVSLGRRHLIWVNATTVLCLYREVIILLDGAVAPI